MSEVYVAQPDQHQVLEWVGGSRMSVLLDAARTDGQLVVTRTALTRGDSAPLHVHSREDEVFVVLEGDVTFWAGEERHEVSAGGLAWLPRDLPHTYRVDSDTAQFLTLCTPAGVEGFFRSAGHDVATPKPNGWVITPQTLGAAMAAHGGQVLGPPKGPDD